MQVRGQVVPAVGNGQSRTSASLQIRDRRLYSAGNRVPVPFSLEEECLIICIFQRCHSGGRVLVLDGKSMNYTLAFSHLHLFCFLVPQALSNRNKYPLDALLKPFCPLEYVPVTTQHRSDLEDLFKLCWTLCEIPFCVLLHLK